MGRQGTIGGGGGLGGDEMTAVIWVGGGEGGM